MIDYLSNVTVARADLTFYLNDLRRKGFSPKHDKKDGVLTFDNVKGGGLPGPLSRGIKVIRPRYANHAARRPLIARQRRWLELVKRASFAGGPRPWNVKARRAARAV